MDHANKEGNSPILVNDAVYNNCSNHIANSDNEDVNNKFSDWLYKYDMNGVGKIYGGDIVTDPYENEYKQLKKEI